MREKRGNVFVPVELALPLEGGFLDDCVRVASSALLQAAFSSTIPSKTLLPAFFNCCTYLAKPKLEFGSAVEILDRFFAWAIKFKPHFDAALGFYSSMHALLDACHLYALFKRFSQQQRLAKLSLRFRCFLCYAQAL